MASKFAGLALSTEKPFRVQLYVDDCPVIRDKEGNPAYIDVLSLDSKEANELDRAVIDSRIAGDKIDARAADERYAERLAKLTVGWYLVLPDGTPADIPFTVEEAKELYLDPACRWIRDRVAAGAATRKNFMPAPQKG